MEQTYRNESGWRSGPWRVAAWATAAALMLAPVAVQLISGNFGWSVGDFIFAGLVLFGSCFIFDLAARRSPNFSYLAASGAALAAGLGLFVVNGAVGLVGSEDEAHNLLFFVPILAAIVGALVARGRSEGMARAMLVAAISHIVVSAALLVGATGRVDGNPVAEVIGLSIFAAIWLASAWLFRNAAR